MLAVFYEGEIDLPYNLSLMFLEKLCRCFSRSSSGLIEFSSNFLWDHFIFFKKWLNFLIIFLMKIIWDSTELVLKSLRPFISKFLLAVIINQTFSLFAYVRCCLWSGNDSPINPLSLSLSCLWTICVYSCLRIFSRLFK